MRRLQEGTAEGMMDTNVQPYDEVLGAMRVPLAGANRHVYVITAHGGPLNVYAQQVRALNLVWALSLQDDLVVWPRLAEWGHMRTGSESLAGRKVVVIGAGMAGLTAATAARLLGAEVRLLEKAPEALGLQRGCHHRFLHPRIAEWPYQKSLMAAAHLPIMDWSVGTADAVARRLLEQFESVQASDRNGLKLCTRVQDVRIAPDYDRVSFRREGGPEEQADCQVLIFAMGFGVERTVDFLPARSYWRLDPVDQSPVSNQVHSVLVAGEGDGGIIDVLRAVLAGFDHGPFIDRFLDLLEPLVRLDLLELENRLWREGNRGLRLDQMADLLREGYREIQARHAETIQRVRSHLGARLRPSTYVTWTGELPIPLNPRGMPFNRFLAWQLNEMGQIHYKRASVCQVRLGKGPRGERYLVDLALTKDECEEQSAASRSTEAYHDVIIRYGSETPPLRKDFPAIHQAMEQAGKGRSTARPVLQEDAFDLFWGLRPSDAASGNATLIAALSPAEPVLDVKAFDRIWRAYRIRLSVLGAPPWAHRLEYVLHPEFREVHRRADRGEGDFASWVYTFDDYWVEARLPSGSMLAGSWLTTLLQRGDPTGKAVETACHNLTYVALEVRGRWRYPPWSLRAKAYRAIALVARALRGHSSYRPGSPPGRPEPFEKPARPEVVHMLEREAARPAR